MNPEELKALREKRGKIVAEMRAILEAAEAEKRAMTAEEEARHGALYDEQDAIRRKIEVAERQRETERQVAEQVAAAGRETERDGGGAGGGDPAAAAHRCFREYLRTGRVAGEGAAELRALSAGADIEGGYIVAPEQFVNMLIRAIDDQVFMRSPGFATTFSVPDAASLGVPTLDADPADADWTTELLTGSADSTMAFGKRSLHPHPVAKRIKISNELIRRATMGAEALVIQRLGYKFAITHEKAFLTGSGAGQPLGVFTASANGISTGRDVSTGNTTTALTFDGLIEAKFSVKGGYWPRARWLFHRDAVKMIAKLKDGEGQYLWRQSVREGEPDMILGRPVAISEYAPNTFTTGLYVGMYGDFSHYWIADALDMQFQRLVELYAETNQVGIIGRAETDGMPVLEEAFARVTLA